MLDIIKKLIKLSSIKNDVSVKDLRNERNIMYNKRPLLCTTQLRVDLKENEMFIDVAKAVEYKFKNINVLVSQNAILHDDTVYYDSHGVIFNLPPMLDLYFIAKHAHTAVISLCEYDEYDDDYEWYESSDKKVEETDSESDSDSESNSDSDSDSESGFESHSDKKLDKFQWTINALYFTDYVSPR